MKLKSILILLVVFLVLLGVSFYPYIQNRIPGKAKVSDTYDLPFHSFTKSFVSQIDIKKKNDEISLIKDGESWKVASFSASTGKIDALFNAFQSSTVENIVSRNSANQQEYNLASDSGTFISLKTEKGNSKIILGKEGPDANSLYVKKDGSTDVYLVSGPLSEAVLTTVSDWRDKNVVSIPIANIQTIEISGVHGFTLKKSDQSKWEINIEGKKKELEDSDVTSTLNFMTPLEGSGFADESESKEFLSAKPDHIIIRDKDQKELGNLSYITKDGYYWIQSNSNPYVIKVPGYKLDNLFKLKEKSN